MALVRALAEAGRRVRAEAQRRQRLPCRAGWIVGGSDITQFHDLLAEELNVASLAVETDLEKFQQVELRPNFKSLGAKVKGDLPAVKAALDAASPSEFAGVPVTRLDTTDGWRFMLEDGWLLFRLSGTEPLLRIYTELRNEAKVAPVIAAGRALVGSAAG